MRKEKRHSIVATLWFLAAIGFFIAGAIGKNMLFISVGALSVCVGCLYLAKGKSDSKNKNE